MKQKDLVLIYNNQGLAAQFTITEGYIFDPSFKYEVKPSEDANFGCVYIIRMNS